MAYLQQIVEVPLWLCLIFTFKHSIHKIGNETLLGVLTTNGCLGRSYITEKATDKLNTKGLLYLYNFQQKILPFYSGSLNLLVTSHYNVDQITLLCI